MWARLHYLCVLSLLLSVCNACYGINLQVKPIFGGQQKIGASTEVRLAFTAPQEGNYQVDIRSGLHHYQSTWALHKNEIVELPLLTPPLSDPTAQLQVTGPNQEHSSATLIFSPVYITTPLILLVQEDTQTQTVIAKNIVSSNIKGFPHHIEALSSIDHIILDGSLMSQFSDHQLTALLSFTKACGSISVVAKQMEMFRSLQQVAGCSGHAIQHSTTIGEALSTLSIDKSDGEIPLDELLATDTKTQAFEQQVGWIIAAYFTILLGILWLFPRPLTIGAVPVITSLILGIFLLRPAASISRVVWTEQNVETPRTALQTQHIVVNGRAPGDISFDLADIPIQRFFAEGNMALLRNSQEERTVSQLHSHTKLFAESKASFSNHQTWDAPYQIKSNTQGLSVVAMERSSQAGYLLRDGMLWYWPAIQVQTQQIVRFADLKPVENGDALSTPLPNWLKSHYAAYDWVIVLPPPPIEDSQTARPVAHWYVLKQRNEASP